MNKKIYLAGGCFWGVQAFLKLQTGVVKTIVGYANSNIPNPTYKDVCDGKSIASEAVEVVYDSNVTSIETLITSLFDVINPTELNKQGPDVGVQYRNGVYFIDANDELIIKNHLEKLAHNYSKPLTTEVLPLLNFYPAEEYHQDYLDKNPSGYCHIKLPKH
ncbi:peptide-methionine (S)-S-oxide reductase MsrA [Mycoplasmopsis columbinasalis]|uniref:Peptide methionine sulfoxide reductase MsrA n=1 Tax=Mycoplasmopsis columbinasalis TaxID=114880 RepID=A0A449BAG4_9BACT|nr:peptide-methionine (S)-S-oxide reductase MsrA [Mycoplasmopsis columbinasalis]VEU78194.1 peptide-methionine (S)-S-oxide reductase [Mycoplasmopsis columbinasalis]